MSKKEYARYMSSVQLYLLKKNNNKIFTLLQQRSKNSWAPLQWEAGACGHVDHGESPTDAIIHEAKEEIDIKILKKDLKFISLVYKDVSKTKDKKEHAFYNSSFCCYKWIGVPKIKEHDKTIDLKWFDINKLPKNIIPDRKISIENMKKNITYCEYVSLNKK
ncbi:MAG: NUDIX domain-containing protein [Mycoplasmataceae bacterium]|jgi:ADP-ribose pyrophosphatase YjhB (NUDIX family)|nr:NUDIX domain-containing protein [Mycoplasmataceae bacterium]